MIVLLRISPKSFNKPLPLGFKDKMEAVYTCLESLKGAGIENHKLVVISDEFPQFNFPLKYHEWLDKNGFGNEGTFYSQTDYSTSQADDEVVLYLEDDYLWRPDTLDSLEKAARVLGFVSPYDHPAHYIEARFDKHYLCGLVDNLTYRTAPSNTLTFAAPVSLIKKHAGTLKAYGINDHEMWSKIMADGDYLWNPSYSMATHLVEGCLAPNIDWSMLKYT